MTKFLKFTQQICPSSSQEFIKQGEEPEMCSEKKFLIETRTRERKFPFTIMMSKE
jgi:hypothetical protein